MPRLCCVTQMVISGFVAVVFFTVLMIWHNHAGFATIKYEKYLKSRNDNSEPRLAEWEIAFRDDDSSDSDNGGESSPLLQPLMPSSEVTMPVLPAATPRLTTPISPTVVTPTVPWLHTPVESDVPIG